MHRAALVLHGLGEADRAWVLQALSVEQQGRLRPLLRELGELGIPADATLFGPLVERRPPEQRAAGPEPLEQLEERELAGLALLLAAEPPRVAAVLLSARSWRWRERVLARLPAAAVEAIHAVERPEADALQAAVVAQVARQLQAQEPAAPRLRAWWSQVRTAWSLALPRSRR